MRSDEINVAITEATRKLREVNLRIDELPPIGHNSPVGREFAFYREQLLATLRDLRAELLATANDELRQRRDGSSKKVEGEASCET
jgi:hypothetical protein